MKITIFTSNNFRHNYLVNQISKISSKICVVQECNTIHPGKVEGYYKKNKVMKKYFSNVLDAQNKVFKNEPVNINNKVKLLSMKYGDLNVCSMKTLKPFLESNIYIIFGASYIKGKLAKFLIKKKAINIHMGISPHFRGTDSNFWAIYKRKYQYVGATIHLLSNGLDDGKILYHALSQPSKNPFLYTMLTVKSAIDSLSKLIKNKKIHKYKPVIQDKSLMINYSRKKDFNSNLIKNFREYSIPKFTHNKNEFVRPSILKHSFK